jgi:tRNA1Val (adenine37-N6)-methyltransferase
MSNSFFQFKRFTLHQDQCAMKVSTDACIQGAWTPVAEAIHRVLDIGAGTGLLSLMIAQRILKAVVDAIELDASAAQQAKENVLSSPFAKRIHVIQADASKMNATCLYDLIVCNPPFFKNALLGPDAGRNAARHIDGLDARTLIQLCLVSLAPQGIASFLWPRDAHLTFVSAARREGLYLQQELNIRHRAASAIARTVGIFGKERLPAVTTTTLVIKDEQDRYTPEFTDLLRPFYLYL